MARIPEAEIERLKREIALERLVEARGVVLKRKGADLVGRCPFGTHTDAQPSFVVTPAKNLWHCFGCQQGGSVIDWVMKVEGVSFRHAVELLRDDNASLVTAAVMAPAGPRTRLTREGMGRSTNLSLSYKSTVPKLESPLDLKADDRELLRQVIGYYHETLKESPAALSYLAKRGLQSEEAIARFKLGYANRTLGYRLPQKNRVAGAESRGRLQQLGILRESGHEHFNGCLVIPVFDEHGAVTEIYGRKFVRGLHPDIPLHLYLPGPHKGVWNVEALQASKEIILCEALIDALTFWCAGYRNVTASYGVEGFTEDHLAAFRRYGTERVLIAYDRDDAGEKAAESLAEKLMACGLECFRIHFPKGMDANEYALTVKPPEKSLGVLIRSAIWLGGKSEGRRMRDETPLPTPAAVEDAVVSSPEATSVNESESLSSLVAKAADETNNSTLPDSELLASPMPSAPAVDAPLEIHGDEIVMRCGDRRYRVRGLAKNLSFDQMKVNVLASRCSTNLSLSDGGFHVDTIEMYAARQRQLFIKQAAEEICVKEEVVKRDFGKLLLKLEELQDEQIRKTLEPKEQTVTLTDEERNAALELLRDPNLLQRILTDHERCGVVGEETNKLVCYLASVSRKLDEPLAIIIQSSSAAGKSWLMNAVLQMMPEEEQVKYSAMTGQSLFYMSETNLRHKILAIVEEEGAERASYALKLLQSEGELTIASTGKDPTNGRLVTHEYRVEGPVMILLTTTAVEVDEELLNRCIVLTVDEDREQTRAIHRLQRERQTLEGLLARRDRDRILAVHRNAQRLLRPVHVTNPFARELTFLDDQTRTRRDHLKYLTLIRSIALLHQYQRPAKSVSHHGHAVQYIEATIDDIAAANALAHEALGRSLDELAPQTRRLLLLIDEMVTQECKRLAMERRDYRFSRRQVREFTNWGNTQLKLHLHRLEELEYLMLHRGGRGQSFVYELLYDGQGKDGKPFLCGLIEVDKLRANHNYDGDWSGVDTQWSGLAADWSGPSRAEVGRVSGGGRSDSTVAAESVNLDSSDASPKTPLIGTAETAPSYLAANRKHAQGVG
ncbi:MAG TPA: CHC2 zinc finger domain-containing protein [Candidatus Dormibacteraeota bacterium]|nr:CHC2 zinc finger domain-containing protein [Candidatus Dormibacteraeota bacterium]